MAAPASADERAAVDALLGAPQSRWEGGDRDDATEGHLGYGGAAARARRHLLLPALQAVQGSVGWISEGAMDYICERLNVPPADAWGVATFYALLATNPRPRAVVHVCDDIACKARGADDLCARFEKTMGPAHAHAPHGEHVTVNSESVTWMRSPCLGFCDHAPAAFVQVAEAEGAQEVLLPAVDTPAAGSAIRLLSRVGRAGFPTMEGYLKSGGFSALRKALQIGAEAVIKEVTDSKLMGRGGAAFPTGRKWAAVAGQAEKQRYLICNADESEPGTFKDRVLLEGDPFAIVEAMTIGAFATGCETVGSPGTELEFAL